MNYLNEIDQTTKEQWLMNFSQASANIYEAFQEICFLQKDVYEVLNNHNTYNIRLYMGLDENNKPKVIALSSYYMRSADYPIKGYSDLLVEGKIFELVDNEPITLAKAKEYAANWKAKNSTNTLFKTSFHIPRPNVVTFFEELSLNSVKLFFGIDNNGGIKMMMQDANPSGYNIVVDKIESCLPDCPEGRRLI